jgi:hypothetical protein
MRTKLVTAAVAAVALVSITAGASTAQAIEINPELAHAVPLYAFDHPNYAIEGSETFKSLDNEAKSAGDTIETHASAESDSELEKLARDCAKQALWNAAWDTR